jgi:HK97 family phage prohead protease
MTVIRESMRAASLQLETGGNGRTLSGLAVPYGQLAEIRDARGHYQEQIAPGAFTAALATSKPKMLFEHGLDTRTGKTPIGSFDRVWEESDGIHVSGQLFNNELVRPLTDAARAGELGAWSIHFRTASDGSGEKWARAKGWDVRTVTTAQLPEISLVNFGAYQTTLSVRSNIDQLADRSDADGAGGGPPTDEESRNDAPSQEQLAALRIRDRVWRMKRTHLSG